MTNDEISEKQEEEIHLRGFSNHTYEEYMSRAKSFMLYANRPLKELTEQDIRAYLLYLIDVKKLSAASVIHLSVLPALNLIINIHELHNKTPT